MPRRAALMRNRLLREWAMFNLSYRRLSARSTISTEGPCRRKDGAGTNLFQQHQIPGAFAARVQLGHLRVIAPEQAVERILQGLCHIVNVWLRCVRTARHGPVAPAQSLRPRQDERDGQGERALQRWTVIG